MRLPIDRSARGEWRWPLLVVGIGAVVAAALWGWRDRQLYAELAVPAVPLVVAALGAAGLLLVRRRRAVRTRREAAIEAAAAQRAELDRRRLVQRLDHEIKNPLTAIRAGVANLAASPLPPDGAAALASVEEQATRLAGLLGDLRKLAEVEQAPLERTTVDVAALCQEVAAAAPADIEGAAARRIDVVVPELPWPVGTITADPDLLFLALLNVVANAVKFTAADGTGRVEIRAVEEDRHAVVEVADNGVGIPVDEQAIVWDELARGAGARTVPGSGVGLALVRTIVGRHGGEVSLRSRPGQGTVVRLRFPR